MDNIGADWGYWTISDHRFYETKDEMIIMSGRYNAKNNATGKIIRAQVVHIWKLKDGKAVSFQQYADTCQVNEAMIN